MKGRMRSCVHLCAVSSQDAADLESHGLLFQAPSSAMFLSSGMGKHWPQACGSPCEGRLRRERDERGSSILCLRARAQTEARGVYVNSSKDMAIWINEEATRVLHAIKTPQFLSRSQGSSRLECEAKVCILNSYHIVLRSLQYLFGAGRYAHAAFFYETGLGWLAMDMFHSAPSPSISGPESARPKLLVHAFALADACEMDEEASPHESERLVERCRIAPREGA